MDMEVGQWTVLAATAVTVLVVMLVLRLGEGGKKAARRRWPGPPRYPFVGNLPQLSSNKGELLHIALGRLARTHGPVMRVWLGAWRPVVVVSGHQAAWEVFVSKAADYAARSVTYSDKLGTPANPTIFCAPSGAYWHTVRRGLQGGALGPLHVSAQSRRHEADVEVMIRAMQAEADAKTGTVTALPHIRRMVARLLSRLCFGSSFDDETFAEEMVAMVEEHIQKTNHGSISDIFPFLRHFKLLDRTYRDTQRIMRRVVEFFTPILSSETLPPGCYAHFLLSQDVPLDATAYLVFEIFLLGMDSTVNTTAWALRFLILNPGIQEKLHEEVRDWCNSNGCKTVRAEDVGKLQYLQAVVKETLRMKPIAPLVPRKAVVDTTLAGKKVPMDAEIFVNVYAVHYDQELWPKPHRFVPERFLPSASSKARKSGGGVVLPEGDNDAGDGVAMAMEKTHLPFGGGMRACAGVDVGKLQVAFAVANLVKAFQWSPVEGKGGAHDLDEELFFVLMMKNPLVARITPRSHI